MSKKSILNNGDDDQPTKNGVGLSSDALFGTWQPIATAPKDGTMVFIKEKYNHIERDGRVQVAKWLGRNNSEGWYVQLTQLFNDYYPTSNVTHWMPIPSLPN